MCTSKVYSCLQLICDGVIKKQQGGLMTQYKDREL